MNPDTDHPWLEEEGLSPGLKADLDVARASSGTLDVDKGAARLVALLGAATLAEAAAAPRASAFGKATWWGLGGVGLAGVVLAVVVGGRSTPSAELRAPLVAPRVAASETSAPVSTAQAIELPSLSVDALPSVAAPASAPPARPSAATPELSEIDRVRAEVDQAAAARALLATSPEDALAAAEQGHRRFAGGVVYPEREAIAIEALARLGRANEARQRAAAFLKRTPQGPLAERVRQLTAAP